MSISSCGDVRRTRNSLFSFFCRAERQGENWWTTEGGLGIVMMKHTVALVMFQSASSLQTVNPNTNLLLLSRQPGQMFSLWPAQKLSVFVSRFVHSSEVRGRPGLRAKLSRQVQTFNSHPSVMKTHRGEGGGQRRRLHRRLVITLSKDLLSICWCAREHVLTPCDWITEVARGALERGQARP